MALLYLTLSLLLFGYANSENTTLSDTCELEPWDSGPWAAALEEWTTSAHEQSARQGRVMALPPAKGYYVTERIDIPFLRPPPPNHHPNTPHMPAPPGSLPNVLPLQGPSSNGHHAPPQGSPPNGHYMPPQGPAQHGPPKSQPRPYEEWQATPPTPPGVGKIVNRPTNPYKDKFKPSYQLPPQNQPIPVHQAPPGHRPNAADRVDEPPGKQVSETDLYLLTAIEKLVYRVDLMEKRLRKMEENIHYLVAGKDTKPDPCVANFSRIGDICYHFSSEAWDWKTANLACRKLRANLVEFDNEKDRRKFIAAVQGEKRLKDTDWWTSGLNPGLLWIWSHSGRQIIGNTTNTSNSTNQTVTIVGDGRCLAMVYDPTVNNYVYRGQDCALKHRYVCKKEEDKAKIGNEIERVARKLKSEVRSRKPKILWESEDP